MVIFKIIYFSTWIFAVFYCVLCFSRDCINYFQNYQDDYGDFTETDSTLFSRKKDKSDLEWESITILIHDFLPWMFSYLFVADIIRSNKFATKIQQFWQSTFILTYFLVHTKCTICLVLFLQPAFFYILRFLSKTNVCTWLCSCLSLLSITISKKYSLIPNSKFSNEHQFHFFVISLSWINLRCTSFFLEQPKCNNFLILLSYCLYPPTIFTGPFILYEDFKFVYNSNQKTWNNVTKTVKNIIFCIMWYLIGNFCLHFVYVSATSFQPQFVEKMDYASLCGYGYAMGQFFHLKYVIQYGLSTALASYENVKVPHLPRCIGRIHLYSDMWRYFDSGLYIFLKKHIYLPVLEKVRYKLIASFFCFLFVCIWHGVEEYIIIWTVMNYIGICIEHISCTIYRKYLYHIFYKYSRITNILQNTLASPLLAFSAISNFYFFGGKEIGDIFLKRLFANVHDSSRLIFVLFCCCQVSSHLKKKNARKM